MPPTAKPFESSEVCGLQKFSACSTDPHGRPGPGVRVYPLAPNGSDPSPGDYSLVGSPFLKSGAPVPVRERHIVRQVVQVELASKCSVRWGS